MKTQSPNYRAIVRSLRYLSKQSHHEVSVAWIDSRHCKIICGQEFVYPVTVQDGRVLEATVADRLEKIVSRIASIKFREVMANG